MVIYGWNSSHIKTIQSPNTTCPNCGEKGGLIISFHGKYFHFFWIPTFSLGKRSAAQCTKCNKIYDSKNLPEDLVRDYKDAKSEAKVPIWHFSGLFLITLLIGFITYSSKAEAKKELEYINNPLVGDVYEYEEAPNNFTTIKVVEVTNDSIYFLQNNYAFTTKNGIEEIQADSCYNSEVYNIARTDIKKMFEDGTIFDINRK